MKAIGLQKKQRPPEDRSNVIRSASGIDPLRGLMKIILFFFVIIGVVIRKLSSRLNG